jgi:hypothetical protein
MLKDKLCSNNPYTDDDDDDDDDGDDDDDDDDDVTRHSEVACSISPAELQCAVHNVFVRYEECLFVEGNHCQHFL